MGGDCGNTVDCNNREPDIDPYFESEFVFSLNKKNYQQFINTKDVALIMFYDPSNSVTEWCRRNFAAASRNTRRRYHGYGAVNCRTERGMCCEESVEKTPSYKLYSGGRIVNVITDGHAFKALDMRKFVENAP